VFIPDARSSLMICSLYGDNEELLGKWFKRTGKRDQIFLATKFGYLLKDFRKFDSSAEYAKKACEKSLETLGVDYIDLCESFQLRSTTFGDFSMAVELNKSTFCISLIPATNRVLFIAPVRFTRSIY